MYTIVQNYENQKQGTYAMPSGYAISSWTKPDFILSLLCKEGLELPRNIAAMVGETFGTAGTGGAFPCAALAGYQASAVAGASKEDAPWITHEIVKRESVGNTLMLAGTTSPWSAAGLWYYAGKTPQYLPLEAVGNQLLDDLRKKTARDLVDRDLVSLAKEIRQQAGKSPQTGCRVSEKTRDGYAGMPRDHPATSDKIRYWR